MREITILLAFAASLSSGCAAWDRACEQVAEVDDHYATAMVHLRHAGLLAACDMECAGEGEDLAACERIRESACEAKTAVLAAQSGLQTAYRLCYDDGEEQ
jgi:hypothetical protein